MESKLAWVLIGCVVAGSYSAQAATGAHQTVNLDWQRGARYFPFPEGAKLSVTQLNCVPQGLVVVACRTATRAKCGNWRLSLNGTATAGSNGKTGVASMQFSGPRDSVCRATLVVESP